MFLTGVFIHLIKGFNELFFYFFFFFFIMSGLPYSTLRSGQSEPAQFEIDAPVAVASVQHS